MREIKFRAWDKYEHKMLPVKGLSFDYCEEIGIKGDEIGVVFGKPYMDELSIAGHKTLGVANHCKSVDTCILMQYTGLKDKNGKEIYEGDILRYNYHIDMFPGKDKEDFKGEVIWKDHTFEGDLDTDKRCVGFILKGIDIDKSFWYTNMPKVKDIEIIGNIYENPDLLTKKGE